MPGEGSVFRRASDGAWLAQLSSGPRGHRSYQTRSARTKADARRRLEEMKADRRAGLDLSKLSLGVYLRLWLDESAKLTVSANTLRGYEDVLIHLEPIAGIPLTKLTAEDIEACANRMVTHRSNAKSQQPASPKTVRNAQVMLRRALGQAELRGHVRRNVAKLVPLRRVPRSSVAALTPERAGQILRAIADDRLEAAYALAFAGLRSSEILGIARSDLDLDKRTLTVRYQIAGSGRTATRVATKTAASAATIPLPDFAIDRLRAHLGRLADERPFAPIGDFLVFVTPKGLPINGSWFTKHFQALLLTAGLPTMRLHDMRHGAASLLVDAGAHPRVAQELLRHAPGSKVTMERYAHVTAAQQRQAADLLDEMLTRAAPESVTESVTHAADAVIGSRPEEAEVVDPLGETGSGGRTRTYDQAVTGTGKSTWLLLILFGAGLILYLIGKFMRHLSFMETLTRGTIHIDIRAVFTLIIVLVALAESLGTEIILGSFLAGVLISLLSPDPQMVSKLDSFGYGFLIPVFFVMVGVNLNLREVFSSPTALMLVPLLFAAFFIAKLIPVLILKKWYDWRTVMSIGFLISAKLTLVIAAAKIGQRLHIIDNVVASAVIFVGVLSCIVGPVVFKKFYPIDIGDEKKQVVFVGANQLTLPISVELDTDKYQTFLFHKRKDNNTEDLLKNQNRNSFKVEEIPDYEVSTLEGLRVFDGDVIIIATGDDDTNAKVARAARNYGAERVIARIESPEMAEELEKDDIRTYSSFFSTKTVLKSLIQTPHMINILTREETGMTEIEMNNAEFNGTELRAFPFMGDTIIVRIFREEDSIVPHGDTRLKMGDRLIVTGSHEHIDRMSETLGRA